MFSDSHAHIFSIFNKNNGDSSFLSEIEQNKFRFIMDIGTNPGDLQERRKFILDFFNGKKPDFIHFSAGLWPHANSIAEPEKSIKALNADIDFLLNNKANFCAVGECGLDRFWNGKTACENTANSGTPDIEGEEYLFTQQLLLAKRKKLPVIIHSRDAYKDTVKCIDNVGYHRGVIHCYSYGINEAQEFIKRGWYISFPGNITYPKKQAEKEKIAALIKSIPTDKLLLETDAPYLTPVPFRGKTNMPLLIEYTYRTAAEILNTTIKNLSDLIYRNCVECFKTNTQTVE